MCLVALLSNCVSSSVICVGLASEKVRRVWRVLTAKSSLRAAVCIFQYILFQPPIRWTHEKGQALAMRGV